MCNIRCKGYCCRRFFLPFTPAELRDAVENPWSTWYNPEELKQVHEMVIYLGADRLDANREPNSSGHLNNWYTCKHLNRKTGDCMNYENRPRMCSDFPYDKPCEYHKCSTHPWWRHYKITRWLHAKLVKLKNWVKPPGFKKETGDLYEIKQLEEALVYHKALE